MNYILLKLLLNMGILATINMIQSEEQKEPLCAVVRAQRWAALSCKAEHLVYEPSVHLGTHTSAPKDVYRDIHSSRPHRGKNLKSSMPINRRMNVFYLFTQSNILEQ